MTGRRQWNSQKLEKGKNHGSKLDSASIFPKKRSKTLKYKPISCDFATINQFFVTIHMKKRITPANREKYIKFPTKIHLMGACQGRKGPNQLSAQDLHTLHSNLTAYQDKAQDYQSQIHLLQQQIRAVTVLSPDAESTALRALIREELQSVREFLCTVGGDSQGNEREVGAETVGELESCIEEWGRKEEDYIEKLIGTVGELQVRMQQAVGELRARGVELGGGNSLEEVLTQYERLLEAAQQSNSELTDRIRLAEASTQALAFQSSELASSLDFLRSDLSRKELQLSLTRHTQSQTHSQAVQLESELQSVKRELLQCKEKIKDLAVGNEMLEGEIEACNQVLSDEELQRRSGQLGVRVGKMEVAAGDLERLLVETKGLEERQKEQIAELERQIAAKEKFEDVGEKMSNVQERLRDIMTSLESEVDGN